MFSVPDLDIVAGLEIKEVGKCSYLCALCRNYRTIM